MSKYILFLMFYPANRKVAQIECYQYVVIHKFILYLFRREGEEMRRSLIGRGHEHARVDLYSGVKRRENFERRKTLKVHFYIFTFLVLKVGTDSHFRTGKCGS